jgi:hypothetical protein
MQLSQLLDKFNLQLEDLNSVERQTLVSWAEKLSNQKLTLDTVRESIPRLISALEAELSGLEPPPTFWAWLFRSKRDIYLKARLKNLLMIQDFLTGPERAQRWVEQQLSNIKPK